MKKLTLILLATLALALTGCVVMSVYPFYTSKDVVFEPKLLGKWQEDADKRWVFEKEGEQSYRLTVAEKGDDEQVYDATLFTLGKDRFLDLVQTKPEPGGLYLPPHILVRVLEIGPSLKLAPMSYEWLAKFLEKEPAAIRHTRMGPKDEDNKLIVLTADTKELQQFIRKHLKTEDAWKKLDEMKRVEGRP